jgi:hypothetical protein
MSDEEQTKCGTDGWLNLEITESLDPKLDDMRRQSLRFISVEIESEFLKVQRWEN